MNVILFEPEIPQNTGNIVRTCRATNSSLTLVKPLGFTINDRQMKRAGLDYWQEVSITLIEDLSSFLEKTSCPFYFFSSKTKRPYTDIDFGQNSHLIFGSETSGLPKAFFERYPEKFYTIPMARGARCLNLANSVAVVLYEAHRQQNFLFKSPEAEKESLCIDK